jgi:hypothetical protein
MSEIKSEDLNRQAETLELINDEVTARLASGAPRTFRTAAPLRLGSSEREIIGEAQA